MGTKTKVLHCVSHAATTSIHQLYNSFPGRPSKARAEIDNNCCRVNLSREHVGFLLLDQWVEDKEMYRNNSM